MRHRATIKEVAKKFLCVTLLRPSISRAYQTFPIHYTYGKNTPNWVEKIKPVHTELFLLQFKCDILSISMMPYDF